MTSFSPCLSFQSFEVTQRSSRRTPERKIKEALLALQIEQQLSKDQILELYMNQIFLGQRAYGFAAASEIYFGKAVKDLDIAEAAMDSCDAAVDLATRENAGKIRLWRGAARYLAGDHDGAVEDILTAMGGRAQAPW